MWHIPASSEECGSGASRLCDYTEPPKLTSLLRKFPFDLLPQSLKGVVGKTPKEERQRGKIDVAMTCSAGLARFHCHAQATEASLRDDATYCWLLVVGNGGMRDPI